MFLNAGRSSWMAVLCKQTEIERKKERLGRRMPSKCTCALFTFQLPALHNALHPQRHEAAKGQDSRLARLPVRIRQARVLRIAGASEDECTVW